ncbi:hypothetical protein PPL_08871 [Heterostelium album PN500]|uniref:Glucose-methanol-choline oxidoreductase N-terminal domain-containing protein n=1 Tax=Heterostelium pallidum (strain ATCC 26659 / Pp 5 / PN500) TaxID=670386 RepID=D3BJZ1_HETP5|nr:hypothetical protein PPL_08871 [Heterostelium album PN500]EFA78221.1 hypothetical protein PPL_08871 [Heterostelium album PN500]|eukprot:XP_020430346.1 hypothetical protein PPL_08871 [Heterostelium album PN500]
MLKILFICLLFINIVFGVSYDYIVIGAGSAGSIVSSRLAKNGSSVLVLDAGEESVQTQGLNGQDVAGTQGTFNSKNTYTPQKTFTKYDIPLYWSSVYLTGLNWDIPGAGVAKVTGGCGMHNGMVFQRGQQADYDGWNVGGWNWSSLFPYFLRIETILDPALSASTNHGHSGPIKVKTIPFDQEGNDFIQASASAGLPFNSDFQNDVRDGCGYFQFNIDEHGIRSSPFHKYLLPALSLPNIKLITKVTVLKINFVPSSTSGGPPTARSVLIQFANQSTTIFTANKEIILSAGALNTPKILMNSGIGNSTYLGSYSSKIPNVYSNLPGVGKNLQNHFLAFTVWAYNSPEQRPTFYDLFTETNKFEAGTGDSILATPGFSVGCWLRPNASAVGVSENVMLILPGTLGSTTPYPTLSIGVSISKPKPNNHWIGLSSNQTGSANDFYTKSPELHFSLLNDNDDVQTLIRGILETRRVMSYPPMNSKASSISPPLSISSNSDLSDWVKNNTIAHDHWCGTAKMGAPSDPMAVVDSRLRVIGVNGLRVVDASVIPTIVNSLVHATVMVIAEKGADMILDDNYQPGSSTTTTTTSTTTTTGGGILTLSLTSLSSLSLTSL